MNILIAPFARALRNGNISAKDYPWPLELVRRLEQEGHLVTQVGVAEEPRITQNSRRNLPFKELCEVVRDCDTAITVDSFLNHLCWSLGKKAIVLFGQSDPNIFGHPENINLLKDRKYLRPGYQQFDIWEAVPTNNDAFVSPEEVLEALQSNF